MVNIGTFTLTSGKMMVTDPCYSKEDCTNIVDAKVGDYNAYIHYAGDYRAGTLTVLHQDYPEYTVDIMEEWIPFPCLVDSGQAIIADFNEFKGSEEEYSSICTLTSSYDDGGILGNYGVVSGTGYGDGRYDIFCYRDQGKVVGLQVIFIEEEDEDEEDCDDWYYDKSEEDEEGYEYRD